MGSAIQGSRAGDSRIFMTMRGTLVAAPDVMRAFWARTPAECAQQLGVTLDGLTSSDAAARRASSGPNELHARTTASRIRVLWRQVRSPLVLLLVFAAGVSVLSGERVDAAIVGAILAASIGIGFVRE